MTNRLILFIDNSFYWVIFKQKAMKLHTQIISQIDLNEFQTILTISSRMVLRWMIFSLQYGLEANIAKSSELTDVKAESKSICVTSRSKLPFVDTS